MPEPLDGLSGLGAFAYESEIFEVNEFPLNPGAGRGSLWQGVDPSRALRQILHSRRFDAIVSVGDSSAALYLAWKTLRRSGPPVLLIDPAIDELYRPRIRLQDFVLPRCAHVIVYGRNQCDHLGRRFGDRVSASFVHHRMDTDFFRRRSPGRGATRPCVISVGDDKARDFETVCEAARGIDADFVLKTRNPLPIQPPPNVRVVSERVSFAALRELYEAADVAIVSARPTIHACGVTGLLESMAMSVPTVVTGNAALDDYALDGSNCAVVPPRDAGAMRAGVQRLLSDPGLSGSVSAGGRRFVEEECSLRNYASRLDVILSSIIAGASPFGSPARSQTCGH